LIIKQAMNEFYVKKTVIKDQRSFLSSVEPKNWNLWNYLRSGVRS